MSLKMNEGNCCPYQLTNHIIPEAEQVFRGEQMNITEILDEMIKSIQ